MATKGEDFRAEEQRKARKPKKKATPKPAQKPAPKRKSEGRAKPDTALIRREEARKTSPDARARKSRANSTKVRGSSSGKKI